MLLKILIPLAACLGLATSALSVTWPKDDLRAPKAGEKTEDLPSAAGTEIKAGPLRSQRWTLAGSPYRIKGDIVLPEGQSLVIEAGVTVIFMGAYKFAVYGGKLALEGKPDQLVRLTSSVRDPGWYGILFCPEATCKEESTKGSLSANYTVFEYARANDREGDFRYWRRGGALLLLNVVSVKITNSLFRYNYASETGGAFELIAITNASPIELEKIKFFANEAGSGGAIRLSHINNRSWSHLHFISNKAWGYPDSYGGAMEVDDANQIRLTHIVARGNTASAKGKKQAGLGGAFYCYAPSLVLREPFDIQGNAPESSVGCGIESQVKDGEKSKSSAKVDAF